MLGCLAFGVCLCLNCLVEEKLDFKKNEDDLEEVEKFCCLGDMISCFGGTKQKIGSAWKKFGI